MNTTSYSCNCSALSSKKASAKSRSCTIHWTLPGLRASYLFIHSTLGLSLVSRWPVGLGWYREIYNPFAQQVENATSSQVFRFALRRETQKDQRSPEKR